MKSPLISVITVTYNAEPFLERTIQSVASQTYPHIEYIVMDGKSTDGTLAIAQKYATTISKLVSQADSGLYDAMNKAISLATGDYVIFMNAGDTFFAPKTLEKAFADWNNEDFIYGKTKMIAEDGSEREWYKKHPYDKDLSHQSFKKGMLICHQSMFMKRTLAQPYRLDVGLVADIDWCIRCLKNAKTFKNTDIYISRFLDGGVSDTHRNKALKQRFKLLIGHFGLLPTIWQHLKMAFRAARRGSLD